MPDWRAARALSAQESASVEALITQRIVTRKPAHTGVDCWRERGASIRRWLGFRLRRLMNVQGVLRYVHPALMVVLMGPAILQLTRALSTASP